MYKILTIKDRIRIPPSKFNEDLEENIFKGIMEEYNNKLYNGMFIIMPTEIVNIGEGRIIPGDGAIYYETVFKVLVYVPILNEIVEGEVSDITEYGAFVRIGPIDGFVHMSYVMDDFVSFSKTKTLSGKKLKRTLSIGDYVRARIIAISMKELRTAKIGLTMRQPGLGKIEWIMEEKAKNG